MDFKIEHCSVLEVDAEIIVNAANNYLSCGGGVCGAIFAKAGDVELEAECKELGYVPTGSVAVTNGLKTGAKYIVHAVGPSIYNDKEDWQEKLAQVYKNALSVAIDTGAKSIAFPCISTGIFGCPLEESAKIVMETISNFTTRKSLVCYLCCYTEEEYKTYCHWGNGSGSMFSKDNETILKKSADFVQREQEALWLFEKHKVPYLMSMANGLYYHYYDENHNLGTLKTGLLIPSSYRNRIMFTHSNEFSYAIVKNDRDLSHYIFFTPDQTLDEIKIVYPYEATLKLIKPIKSDYVPHDKPFVFE